MKSSKRVLNSAINALAQFSDFDACDGAITLLSETNGPVILSGIGKSGHVARKLASTFRSLGRNAHFIHAAEASHGDLGCFVSGAVVILLSNSGETSELSDIIYFCQERKIPIIAITATHNSTLAKASAITIAYGEIEEADTNGLAPTTSTTLSMVIGDALAIGYAEAREFHSDEFAHFHPRGRLGARLKRVEDIMQTGDALPLLPKACDMRALVFEMSQKARGIAILMDGDALYGVITDGDLRRHAETLWELVPSEIATQSPRSIAPNAYVEDAMALMNEYGVTQLIVKDDDALLGLVHLHDCMSA